MPYFDQMTIGIADVAADLVLVMFRGRQKVSAPSTPFRVHGQLLTRSGSRGVSRVTAGLSSVGPPPALTMTQLLDSAT
jgi:hypothetical protein